MSEARAQSSLALVKKRSWWAKNLAVVYCALCAGYHFAKPAVQKENA